MPPRPGARAGRRSSGSGARSASTLRSRRGGRSRSPSRAWRARSGASRSSAGVDVRDLDLVAFGGAGPAARRRDRRGRSGCARVIVPPHPGLASAYGTLLADRRVDRRSTHYARSDSLEPGAVAARLEAMERDAARGAGRRGVRAATAGDPRTARDALRGAEPRASRCRPVDAGTRASEAVSSRFHALHHDVYGYSFPGETLELIHIGVDARSARERARPPRRCRTGLPAAARRATSASAGMRSARRSTGATICRPGAQLAGPGRSSRSSTRRPLVPPGQVLHVLRDGILTIAASGTGTDAATRSVDPVTTSVIGDQLVQITQEMGTHMMRARLLAHLQRVARLLVRALRPARADDRAGPLQPGAPRRDRRDGPLRARRIGAESSRPATSSSTTTRTAAAATCPSTCSSRPSTATASSSPTSATIAHMAEIGGMSRSAPSRAPRPRSTRRACGCRRSSSSAPASRSRTSGRSCSRTTARRRSRGATCTR